jgi:hypothetical protein
MAFNGVANLRDGNESVQVEPWMLKELAKCAKDPIYFIRNYVYINTKDKGMQLFGLYDFQEELIGRFNENRFNIAKYPRQAGKSATTRAYILWYALFNEDKVVAILANKLNLAQEQLQQLRDSYLALPIWMQPGVKQWNKRGIQFSHGTRVVCAATSPDGIRGMSINLLYLDEFAFVKSHLADEFIASVFPTISSGKTTKVIITSCVTKYTMIFTENGIQEIGDFIDENKPYGGYEIPEYKVLGMRNELNTGVLMHNEGKVPTKVITSAYSELECSLEHKLWACKNGEYGWFKSKELDVGDFISIKYGMNQWGNDDIDFIDTSREYKNSNRLGNLTKITPDIAYFLGMFIAEGNARQQVGLTYVDITCGDDLTKSLNALGLRYSLTPDKLHYRISSTSLVLLLKYLGFELDRKAPKKIIPPRLMQMSKECTSAMIQGIFDGDGWTTKGNYRIGIRVSSKRLIQQIKMLFINYGILSTYGEGISRPTELVKVESRYYFTEVTRYDMVKKYFDEIGFRFNRKQSIFETFKAPTRIGHKDDLIPYSTDLLKQWKKEKNIPYRGLKLPTAHKRIKHISRHALLEFRESLNDQYDITDSVFDHIDDNIIWTPITNITDSENNVYDFSLNDVDGDKWCHSVIYNGIVGHQTPNGMNHFFRMWEDGRYPDEEVDEDSFNGYIKSEIPWNAKGLNRDEQWARDEIKTIGEIRFNQEYKCDFVGSVSTLIDHNFLKTIKSKKPLNIPKLPEYMKIYELPRRREELETKNWEYVASLDSGYGVHQDYSVLHIFLVKSNITVHQVATIAANNMEIEEFCKKCYVILKKYHEPGLIIEQNGPGGVATNFFYSQAEYENLLHFDPKGQHMGLWASAKLKQNACILFKTYIQRKFMHLYDKETINEMHSFGRLTQEKWGGLGGNHDDRITAAYWIPYYLQSPFYYGNIVEVNLKALEEDEVILKTEEQINSERTTLAQMQDPKYHNKTLSDSAEYLSDARRPDDDEPLGLIFRQ